MDNKLEVKKTLTINAETEKIWDAITIRIRLKFIFLEQRFSLIGKQAALLHSRVNLTQKGFANEQALEHANSGWEMILQKMK